MYTTCERCFREAENNPDKRLISFCLPSFVLKDGLQELSAKRVVRITLHEYLGVLKIEGSEDYSKSIAVIDFLITEKVDLEDLVHRSLLQTRLH